MSTQKNNPETTAQGPSQKLGPSAPLELQERGELVQRRKMCAQFQAEIDKLKRECAEQRSAASYNLSMQEAANKERDEAFKLLDEIRRITPPTDTTGSRREGETPETDKATITSGNWPQFEAVRADFARQLERQRDAALAELAGYKAIPKDHVIDRSAPVETQLAQAEAWIAQLQQSYRSIQQTCANKDAQLEALRRDGADLSVKLEPIYHQLCVLKMSSPHWVQTEWLNTLRAAIDSAQRQEGR